MPPLSSLVLVACTWHVGNPSVEQGWALQPMLAPVAEPDVDESVRAAMAAALAARGATGTEPLTVTVTRAELLPSQRGEAGLVYEARLDLQIAGGGRSRQLVVRELVPDPGTAAEAQSARAQVFAALADRAAALAVAWLVDGG